MTASIEITLDAVDAEGAAAFWQAALGYVRLYERAPFIVLGPPEGDSRPRVLIQRIDVVTADKTPVHMDLRVDEPAAEVERLERLGARIEWTIVETDRGGSRWITMADPQGTLFCVCSAREE